MTNHKFLLARKKGMTQIFREDGSVVPVTVLEAGPCTVTALRSQARDGYEAVQLGMTPAREKHLAKPQKVAFEKAGVKPFRVLREFRVEKTDGYALGQEIKSDLFAAGDVVDVIGHSKGRGFSGTIRAHNFQRGPESHGCMNVREPGSLASRRIGKLPPGKRMAKRYGGTRTTVKNLRVEGVDAERGLILVSGGVPGAPNGLLQILTAKTGVQKK